MSQREENTQAFETRQNMRHDNTWCQLWKLWNLSFLCSGTVQKSLIIHRGRKLSKTVSAISWRKTPIRCPSHFCHGSSQSCKLTASDMIQSHNNKNSRELQSELRIKSHDRLHSSKHINREIYYFIKVASFIREERKN